MYSKSGVATSAESESLAIAKFQGWEYSKSSLAGSYRVLQRTDMWSVPASEVIGSAPILLIALLQIDTSDTAIYVSLFIKRWSTARTPTLFLTLLKREARPRETQFYVSPC